MSDEATPQFLIRLVHTYIFPNTLTTLPIMSQYQPPKGTFDLLPYFLSQEDQWKLSSTWQWIESIVRQLATSFNYGEIRTPIFERSELFIKNSGDSSDIVTKEMYMFQDRGDRSMTLRPEGTPAVLRAFLDNQLQQLGSVHKFYYLAPMFRYDRPQAGRYRQHHQFGVEVFGNGTPEQDVEVIQLLHTFYKKVGIKNTRLMINSLGTPACRTNYRQALITYLLPLKDSLSVDSQKRLEINPLRILDSKEPQDQELLKNAPLLQEFLSSESVAHFQAVLAMLHALDIPYQIEHKLVRGLDYYNHTVFEFVNTRGNAQNSIGGGGRYDGLLASMGGPNLPAVGFGCGLERVIRTLLEEGATPPPVNTAQLYLVPMGHAALYLSLTLSQELRDHGLNVEMEMGRRKVKQALSIANQKKVPYVIVIGDDEITAKTVTIKSMIHHSQQTLELSAASIAQWITKNLQTSL
jgi:histidyl-tRNA synthetase